VSGDVVQTKRSVEIVVSYTVTGADLMRADYSARVFSPRHATLTDRNGDVSVVIGGPVPKKDGTYGVNGAKHTIARWRGSVLASEPEWLQNLVRDYCAEAGIEAP
jgi:hypothetical protein